MYSARRGIPVCVCVSVCECIIYRDCTFVPYENLMHVRGGGMFVCSSVCVCVCVRAHEMCKDRLFVQQAVCVI